MLLPRLSHRRDILNSDIVGWKARPPTTGNIAGGQANEDLECFDSPKTISEYVPRAALCVYFAHWWFLKSLLDARSLLFTGVDGAMHLSRCRCSSRHHCFLVW